eukprot:4054613-Ditylum_brightwellii.AAC.1
MKSPTATLVGKKSAKLVPQRPYASHTLDNTPCIPDIDKPKLGEAWKKPINTVKVKKCFTVPRKEDIKPRDTFAAINPPSFLATATTNLSAAIKALYLKSTELAQETNKRKALTALRQTAPLVTHTHPVVDTPPPPPTTNHLPPHPDDHFPPLDHLTAIGPEWEDYSPPFFEDYIY